MEKYFDYNLDFVREFIDLYDFNSSLIVRSNDRRRLKEDYKNKKYTPLVRAFLVYLKLKDDSKEVITPTARKEKKQEIVEEIIEDIESEDSDDDGTIILQQKKIDTSVSKKELERFTIKDFIESEEYKYLLEKDLVPGYIKRCIQEPENVYWEGQYENLKTSYRNLIVDNINV